MTIAYSCVVFSLGIPFFCAAYAKWTVKGYDNKNPRLFLSQLTGKQQRANFSQQNFYETYPAFAVGVVMAHQTAAPQSVLDILALSYVCTRILYAYSYIQNKDLLRTIIWSMSIGLIIALYFVGIG